MVKQGGSTPRLPAEYQEVEWIGYEGASKGLNTGIETNSVNRVEALIAKETAPSSGTVFPSTYLNMTDTRPSTAKWGTIENVSGSSWTASPSFTNETLFDFTVISSTKKDWTYSSYISIGYGSDAYTPRLKFKYMRLYDASEVLLFDGVPCYRKLDGKIGMYDVLNSVFRQTNSTWTKGADI